MKSFSLRKREILAASGEFREAFTVGRRLHPDPGKVEIRYRINGRSYSRLGITHSRKNKSAVARNRLKRFCREWFRHTKATLTPHLDLIFFFAPPARHAC